MRHFGECGVSSRVADADLESGQETLPIGPCLSAAGAGAGYVSKPDLCGHPRSLLGCSQECREDNVGRRPAHCVGWVSRRRPTLPYEEAQWMKPFSTLPAMTGGAVQQA